LGFKPHWQPEDHRSFYTAPEGWGLFVQRRGPRQQTERIEVRHGRLRLQELVFELPQPVAAMASVTASGRPVGAALQAHGREVRLTLEQATVVEEGAAVEVVLSWS
jgi:hypothetical protein